ncbi:hypothetical protein [Acerihabitans arboris]|uniref:Uncharacterized protein n=1 Tax=Acerihabitans arboris TaxID=2691583 RepID=A0A845STC5_9GAMM|nr:hypothetical protein [Acerihabitans arboris]NDL64305.1 hypothetical protein [Acerihabitans arboris]
MMEKIYRAFCVCNTGTFQTLDERMVFFEAHSDEEASGKLTKLLSAVWGVPESAVDFHNLYSESELHKNAAFPVASGTPLYKQQLFEIGWSGGPSGHPVYAVLSDYPLFLVSPINHLRLTKAFIGCQTLTSAEVPDE